MPENEFEKKVSSELQELRVKPSETVWIRVEERIRKKNKRRVFIIVFLLAGIALLGYWQWDNLFGEKNNEVVKTENTPPGKNNTVNDNENKKEQTGINNNTQKEKTDVTDNNTDGKKIVSKDNSINKTDNKLPDLNIPGKTTIDKKRTVLPADEVKKDPKKNKKDPKPAQRKEVTLTEGDLAILTIDEPKTVKDTIAKNDTGNDNVDKDITRDIKTNDKIVDSIKADTISKKPDIKKDSVVKKTDSVLKVAPVDSPVVNIPKGSPKKKWNFGIEFNPGISSFHEEFFSFDMAKSADLNVGGPVTGGNPTPADPAKSNSGFAIQLGGFIKRQFTKRSSLTVGLRWAYYTDKIRIGNRMYPASSSSVFSQLLDALGVNSAYRASDYNSNFTNKYHFIELPVNYIVQLNKNNVHPLTLQTGFKFGRLVGSDVLVYDTAANGIYYSSKKYLNKTQFGISGGLNWKITKKEKFHLTIGPVIDLHVSSLLDNPYEKKKYLLFTGLRTSVLFNSKK